MLRLRPDLPPIDEFAKRLVTFQRGKVIAPFLRLARAVRGKLKTGAAEAAARVLAEVSDVLGLIGKAVVPIGFPIPVRPGLGEVAQAGFAVAPRRLRPLKCLRSTAQGCGSTGHDPDYVVDFNDT